MKSRWEIHKGKRFWYSDYANFGSDFASLQAEIEASDSVVCREPGNSVLVLVDVRGTVGSTEAISYFKQSATRTKRHLRRGAVIGISGLRRLLYEAVARFSVQENMVFDDIEQAKDWLVR